MQLRNELVFNLATANNRNSKSWKNEDITWSNFLLKISTTHRTAETVVEYSTDTKDRQAEIKDIGGFVGGYISGGRKKKENILYRQLVTLDIDYGTLQFWGLFKMLFGNAAAIYTTHKHTATAPRYRLILPLDRIVQPDEYEAIARRIAGTVNIELFDPTTFQPERMMYWPSTSKDGDYFFDYQDGPIINADSILTSYHNWRDSTQWPVSVKVKEFVLHGIKKQEDPLSKDGVIGAFCREHPIDAAIEKFLLDAYDKTDLPDRYTYKAGSTFGGLLVYENKFTFSHHGTDPTSGKLCNAFDLVRFHKFGLKDEDSAPGTPVNKLPSYVAMIEFAAADPETRQRIAVERINAAMLDFSGEGGQTFQIPITGENSDWLKQLTTDKKGNTYSTIDNILLILKNDPNIKGCYAWNDFEQREIARQDLPWRKVTNQTFYITNSDDSNLRHFLEKKYSIVSKDKIQDAMKIIFAENSFHPVREYLNGLVWDGNLRVESLFIDYMGALDSEYLKAVTRKFLCAAIARVFKPGCKFDYCLVLVGPEGIQKSSFFNLLAKTWFSDSMPTIGDKAAFELLQGVWIVELAELASTKRADVESTKHFIAKSVDRYRVPHEKKADNFPRQCIFVATTNIRDFLKDYSGDRRFWPVETQLQAARKKPMQDLTDIEVGQIWAEAMQIHAAGEPLYLQPEIEATARGLQMEHKEVDERKPIIINYLNMLVPDTWYSLTTYERRDFINGNSLLIGSMQRNKICVQEIWCELFGALQRDLTTGNTKPLHNILKSLPDWQEHDKIKLSFGIYGSCRAYIRKIASVASVF